MSNFAKPKDQLLNAPIEYRQAMEDFTDYFNFAVKLRDDVANTFDHPVLWAAIDRLTEFVESRTTAEIKMRKGGYTSDDAFELRRLELSEVNVA